MRITSNEIHIWFVNPTLTDPAMMETYQALLTPEESARQARFNFPVHRQQFLMIRALQRTVLSYYAPHVPSHTWRFANNDYGKPFISDPQLQEPLYFNLSHTDTMIAMVVATHPLIGVDVEYLKPKHHFTKLASELFGPTEVAQLNALPFELQSRRFLELWTLKEAYVKTLGKGITRPMIDFEWIMDSSGSQINLYQDSRPSHEHEWQFWQLDCTPLHPLALALCAPYKIDQNAISLYQFNAPDNYTALENRCVAIPATSNIMRVES